ncbi:MAG: hypothetical protein K2H77_06635 [Alistipes sp.]|nr:hypothetical protein [Alistipes sp.]
MPIEKRWVVKPQGDAEAVAALSAALKLSPVLANLLVQRGIDTVEKAEKFFRPSLADHVSYTHLPLPTIFRV